jgi:hypothetical protein
VIVRWYFHGVFLWHVVSQPRLLQLRICRPHLQSRLQNNIRPWGGWWGWDRRQLAGFRRSYQHLRRDRWFLDLQWPVNSWIYADADHFDSATNASYSEFWLIVELRVASCNLCVDVCLRAVVEVAAELGWRCCCHG